MKRLADTFIRTINDYTSEHRDICAALTVLKVEWASKLKPNEHLIRFQKNADIDGFVADLTADTRVTSHMYQIKLSVRPGDSLFEASFTHHLADDRLDLKISDISRINKYGTQARCIENTYPNLRKYCYCLVDWFCENVSLVRKNFTETLGYAQIWLVILFLFLFLLNKMFKYFFICFFLPI